jgi:hypothetical protein
MRHCKRQIGRRASRLQPAAFRREPGMKHFLIRYQFKNGTSEAWRQHIAEFIANLDGDPVLCGKISYRVMKEKNGAGYYHLAAAKDDEAIKALQSREFFKLYTDETRSVAGGEVEVVPLEMIAGTA